MLELILDQVSKKEDEAGSSTPGKSGEASPSSGVAESQSLDADEHDRQPREGESGSEEGDSQKDEELEYASEEDMSGEDEGNSEELGASETKKKVKKSGEEDPAAIKK